MTTADNHQGAPPKPKRALAETLMPVGAGAVIIFGIMLPVTTLVVETLTHLCGGAFFDPLPTVWHYMFVAAVPTINALICWAVWTKRLQHPRVLAVLSGVAIGISFLYAIAFAPLIPIALAGLLFGGLGFLPMSPLLAFVSAYILSVVLNRRVTGVKTLWPSRYVLIGVTAAVAMLVSTEMGGVFTRIAMTQAVSQDPVISRGGIRMLRTFGNENALLTECYEHRKTMSDILLGALNAYDWDTKNKARRIYYRVTGVPFNAVPRPNNLNIGWDLFRFGNWDDGVGGEEVGGKVDKLSLAESSLNGIVEPQGAVGYFEWTFNFKNDSDSTQEARTQIALPPGAVVSRLTLWINGKPQEAVFGSREATRSAYQAVVRKSRDPVLVTTLGPDRVLLQCFPVPASGGTMRARVGITVPLSLDDARHSRLLLPRLVENNFTVQGGKHNVFVQSPTAMKATFDGLQFDKPVGKLFQAHGFVGADQYEHLGAALVADRSPDVVQAESTFALKDKPVFSYTEKLIPLRDKQPQHVIFVVDCGRSMEKSMDQIAQALKLLPKEISAEVRVASDEISSLTSSAIEGSEHNIDFAVRELPRVPTKGGPDNFKELLTAIAPVRKHQDVTVVWIHGPQPVLADDAWRLQQELDNIGRAQLAQHLHLYDVKACEGADRLSEVVTEAVPMVTVLRRGALKDDLTALFSRWTGQTPEVTFIRQRTPASPSAAAAAAAAAANAPVAQSWLEAVGPGVAGVPLDETKSAAGNSAGNSAGNAAGNSAGNQPTKGTVQTSPYLARLWAADESARLLEAGKKPDAAKLATNFRIVTPVSGAVVLENRAQYIAAGLDPDNPDANAMVPTAPEPEEWMLIFLAAGAILWTVRRRTTTSPGTR